MNRYITFFLASLVFFASCNSLLDKEPTSQIAPEKYLNEASQLGYYANGLYIGSAPTARHLQWRCTVRRL